MEVCKLWSYSTKTVTVICINTSFSSIVFIAHQTSANKTSHCHCFWISVIIIACFIIFSFQSSPDMQICIYQFFTHCVVQFKFCNVYLADYSFHFCIRVWYWLHNIHWAKTVRFSYGISPMASPYKHTSVQYATVSVTFCQWTIIKFCH